MFEVSCPAALESIRIFTDGSGDGAKSHMSEAERSESTAPRWAKRAHDDAALLRRVAHADTAAFEALYRVYFPRLHRFLERVTHRVNLVEEILDDTMLVVWQKASAFNGQSLVSTWIFAIAYRKALKALHRPGMMPQRRSSRMRPASRSRSSATTGWRSSKRKYRGRT